MKVYLFFNSLNSIEVFGLLYFIYLIEYVHCIQVEVFDILGIWKFVSVSTLAPRGTFKYFMAMLTN